MAILYIVTSWLVLQVADVLFDALELPAQWTRLVLAILILGFPFALIGSWVFDITSSGITVDRPGRNAATGSGRKIDFVIAVLLLIAIGGLVADRLVPEQLADVTADAGDRVDSGDRGPRRQS